MLFKYSPSKIGYRTFTSTRIQDLSQPHRIADLNSMSKTLGLFVTGECCTSLMEKSGGHGSPGQILLAHETVTYDMVGI